MIGRTESSNLLEFVQVRCTVVGGETIDRCITALPRFSHEDGTLVLRFLTSVLAKSRSYREMVVSENKSFRRSRRCRFTLLSGDSSHDCA